MDQMTATATPEPAVAPVEWHPWRVAPDSGFEVRDPRGDVPLVQIDRTRFLVARRVPVQRSRGAVEDVRSPRPQRRVGRRRAAALDEARTFTPRDENPTDLASIPRYMRWFESSYGRHTLAAIIHDNLIVDTPNGGALRDDTLSDRFFREMMQSAGVPWLKRWIMWAAVALRSRWAVGGRRRASVLLWLLLSAAGITSFVWAFGAAAFGWTTPVETSAMVAFASTLPFIAALLWGRQYAAGLIAAVAALWILPAAILAGIGYLVYQVLERGADLVHLR